MRLRRYRGPDFCHVAAGCRRHRRARRFRQSYSGANLHTLPRAYAASLAPTALLHRHLPNPPSPYYREGATTDPRNVTCRFTNNISRRSPMSFACPLPADPVTATPPPRGKDAHFFLPLLRGGPAAHAWRGTTAAAPGAWAARRHQALARRRPAPAPRDKNTIN